MASTCYPDEEEEYLLLSSLDLNHNFSLTQQQQSLIIDAWPWQVLPTSDPFLMGDTPKEDEGALNSQDFSEDPVFQQFLQDLAIDVPPSTNATHSTDNVVQVQETVSPWSSDNESEATNEDEEEEETTEYWVSSSSSISRDTALEVGTPADRFATLFARQQRSEHP